MNLLLQIIDNLLKDGYVIHITNETVGQTLLVRIRLLDIPNTPHSAELFIAETDNDVFMLAVRPWDNYHDEGFGPAIENFFDESWGGKVLNDTGTPMLMTSSDNLVKVVDKAMERGKDLDFRCVNNRYQIFVK